MRSRWAKRFLIAAVVVVAAVALRVTVFRAKPVPVTVYRVAAGRVEETVTNSRAGTVKSRRRASLSSEIGGRVVELPVKKGGSVRTGDLLLRVQDADYRAQLDYQERSLETAAAGEREACEAFEQAKRDLARNRKLAEEAIVSPSLLEQIQSRKDTADSGCAAARARRRQAEAAVALARVSLAKTRLLAPFDGVVAELKGELGEWITPSPPGLPMPSVIELIDATAIYVSAPLDEVDVGRVRAGQPVRVTLDAYPAKSFSGRVVRVAPYVRDVEEQNRTFEIEVELDDPAFAWTLVPGSSADVEVILDSKEGVMRIPSYAVLEGGRALVVKRDTLEGRSIETGVRNWEFTEVRKGLALGDLVAVTLDKAEVKEGAKVRIAGETLK